MVVYFSTATNRRLRAVSWSIVALPFIAIDAGTAPLLRRGAKVEASLAAIFYEAGQGNLRSISTSGIAQFQGSGATLG